MPTDTSMDSSISTKGGGFNNNEVDAIERLAAREAYDEDLENIHATLSKRGALGTSLSSSRSNPLPSVNGRSSDIATEEEKGEFSIRGSRFAERRPSHSSKRSEQERDRIRSSRSSKDKDNSDNNSERRRRRSRRRRGSRTEDLSDDGGRPVRSNSTIERLLEYNEPGNTSTTSNESNQERKTSMNPLLLGLSKSRDSGKGGRDVTKQRTKSCERRNSSVSREKRHKSTGRASSTPREKKNRDRSKSKSRSVSKSRSTKNIHEDAAEPRQPLRRRRSSSSKFETSNRGGSSDRKNGVTRFLRATKSLRTTRSYMSEQQGLHQENHGIADDSFEKIWGKKPTSEDLNLTNTSRESTSSTGTDTGRGNMSTRDYSGGKIGIPGSPLHRPKKTKLEKIHELQAKCDRYKIELNSMADERRKCRCELGESREEVASLQQMVAVHEEQSTKLKARVSGIEDELEMARAEQRTERTELSEAAKDLARVNIDYAKSVDEARHVREKLDGLQRVLAEREGEISVLEKELETSNENARQLEADLLYADGQINNLDAEMKTMEREIALYAEAVERDSLQNTNGDDNGANFREAKYEAIKQRFDERERELEERTSLIDERNRILEHERKEFERLRTEYHEQQEKREKEFEDKIALDDDNKARIEEISKQSDQDRLKREDELNKLLKTLEDENIALKGRLKSEQLDSTIKLQSKDKSIVELQSEVMRLSHEQKERDTAPDSSTSLQIEIESLKTEAQSRKTEFKDVQTKKLELEKQVAGLQSANVDLSTRLCNYETTKADQKREFENQKRKTLEWQKKTGEWSEKAIVWKQKAEYWEKKAKEGNNDIASLASEDAAQAEPQAIFLAAAVEKKAASASAANINGSWRLGRRIFGMASDSEDETQALISKLEGENILKQNEIKNLKSEMIKMQSNYKEQAYSKTQACEQLQKEKEAIELKNENLTKELELARKLNRTISDAAD